VLAGHEGKVMAADIAPQPPAGAAQQRQQQQHREDGGGEMDVDGEEGAAAGGAPQHLIGSAGYDRTVKLWAPQDTPDLFGGDDGLPF
jgi:hypothetical protein